MRIAFAGTPDFAEKHLQALVDSAHQVVAVYTQPDRPVGRGLRLQPSPVKSLALARGIPIEQPLSLKSEEAVHTLKSYEPDIMIVIAYGLLLPSAILSVPALGCLNVHASLLPRWRGASPIQQAILAGDKETGVTYMQMDAGLDTGDILTQIKCAISPEDTSGSLLNKLTHLSCDTLATHLGDIVQAPRQVQTATHVTYAPKITKEQGRIDWQLPAVTIMRQICAFNPWPVAYTTFMVGAKPQILRIWRAQAVDLHHNAPPGTIVAQGANSIVINTGQGGVEILQAQLPGKKCLAFGDILRGHPLPFAVSQCLI